MKKQSEQSSPKGQIYLSLQPSEKAVFRAAVDIYAAYIAAGKVTDGNEPAYMQKAIKEALQMAYQVEKSVQSDDETAGEVLS